MYVRFRGYLDFSDIQLKIVIANFLSFSLDDLDFFKILKNYSS